MARLFFFIIEILIVTSLVMLLLDWLAKQGIIDTQKMLERYPVSNHEFSSVSLLLSRLASLLSKSKKLGWKFHL